MADFVYNITIEDPSEVTMEQNVSDAPPGNATEMSDIPEINNAFMNLIIVLYVLVIVVAFVGNGCVIYLVLSQRTMRNVTNYFIASLATSDALMALVCIPITFISNVLVESWPFPAWMCPFGTYFQGVIVFQNAYTLMAISLERYIAIMYPFKRRLTMCQCYLVIALTWFMSFGTPLPTAVVSYLEDVPTDDPNVTHSKCYEHWPSEEQRFSYSITIMILQYFVPLAVLIYTYVRIVIVVWLKDTPPHGQLGGSRRPVLKHRESSPKMDIRTGKYVDPRKRIIKMMMTVVGIYSTCWLPLHTITILGDTNPFIWHNPGIRYVWLSAHWLAMSSCMYNPLIYWWMSERFRGGYKFLLKSIKYQCCTCGHDSLMRSGGRPELHFQSSYSQAGDYATGAPPPPPMPIYRNTAQGGRGVGVNGRGGGGGGNVEGGVGGGSRNGGGRWMDEDRKHKQNGFIFRHDLHADKGETIPLKKTSEDLESGMGSEDGGDGEETRPAYL